MTSKQHTVLDRQQSREVDRLAMTALGISSLVLMENAGRGVADTLVELRRQMPPAGPVLICCGKGNNAGDGFVLARHLNIRDVATAVLLLADPDVLTGDAAANFNILAKTDVSITIFKTASDVECLASRLAGASWVIDGLLGTGAHGNPRAPLDRAIEAMNRAAAHKLAIDLPSGLDCDTGHIATPTFHADHTCTFVASKPGFFTADAQRVTGQVHVLDIGVPPLLIRRLLDESRA
jgi:NAD(P)H-hydrate epimerase